MNTSTRLRPYRINVADSVLEDLRLRLARTRWPTVIPNAGWTYGAGLDELREICDYWQRDYDWRAHEARINRHPQYLVDIEGVDIHVLWIRASTPTMPLLLLHGWPGSVVEYTGLIDSLVHPDPATGSPAFDLVIPSLPGFGFSGKPREGGWHADRIAAVLHHLMIQDLGYPRFGIQGGDWGTIIGTRMACQFPASITGLHINMPFAHPSDPADPEAQRVGAVLQAETAYLQVQNTKPDALTLAQTDSPAGLAAWVLEKFHSWSDCPGRLTESYDIDTLITNLMFYWAPESIASAARIYLESAKLTPPLFQHARGPVPTAVSSFARELYRAPRRWLEPHFDIRQWTDHARGGHFAALEQPDLLLADMRRFFADPQRTGP